MPKVLNAERFMYFLEEKQRKLEKKNNYVSF